MPPAGRILAFAEEVDVGDDGSPSSPARSVRTLAISQLLPTFILTWLPTWPAMAIDGSLWSSSACSWVASMLTVNPEPAISWTVPIAGTSAPASARPCRVRRVLAVARQMVDELLQVRLLVHGFTPPLLSRKHRRPAYRKPVKIWLTSMSLVAAPECPGGGIAQAERQQHRGKAIEKRMATRGQSDVTLEPDFPTSMSRVAAAITR